MSNGRDALPARRRALQIRAPVAGWERHRRPVLGRWNTEAGTPHGCLSLPAGLMSRERWCRTKGMELRCHGLVAW